MKLKYQKFKFEWEEPSNWSTLFVAVSGAHSYGWATPESDLDVRLVYMPDLKEALSVKPQQKTKQKIDGKIDLVSYPIRNFLRLLVKGNGNALENLFQKKLYVNQKYFWQLQILAKDNLHTKFLRHYLGYYNSLKKDLENPTRLERYGEAKLILCSYRVLQAGIILAEDGFIIPDITTQMKFIETDFCDGLLNLYLECGDKVSVNARAIKKELSKLEERLETLIIGSKFPELLEYKVFDDWLLGYYELVGLA